MSDKRADKLRWIGFFGTGCVNKRAPKDWMEKVMEELDRRGEDPGKEEVEGILMEFDWHRDFGAEA
ncbi:hypothetical protein EDM76_01700 [bacterium]|nr:MAG: hypothetical protein EDM76_01700 [bacterium]